MRLLAVLRPVAMIMLIAAPAAAQGVPAECQAMMAAGEKQFTLPSHAFISSTGLGPTPLQSETINIEGASYIKIRDHWMKGPQSGAQIAAAAKAQLKTAKAYTCNQLADELVGTTPTSVYTSHTETGTGKTDTKVWVAKTTGLPLKSEVEIASAKGHATRMSVRYEYENVRVPSPVQ